MQQPQADAGSEVHQTAIDRTRQELKDDLAAERRRVAARRWLSGALIIGLALAALAPIPHPALYWAWVTILFFLIVLALVIFAASFFFNNIETLGYRLAMLDEEAVRLEAVYAMAGSGAPFALFLRSFDAELRGLSQASVESASMTRYRRQIFQSRYGDFDIDFDTSHLDAGAKWQSQLVMLTVIHRRLPVVLLGNHRVEPEMGDELRALGVQEVFAQGANWWTVVTELAKKARVIFFFIEDATPMLVQEMEYVLKRGYPYVIVGEAYEIDKLPAIFAGGQPFVEGAREIIRYREALVSNPNPIDANALDGALTSLGL